MLPKAPLYSLIATLTFVIAAVVLLLFANPENDNTGVFLALIFSTVPSLVAAFASERASRDIRNGTIVEKAREGSQQALDNSGVTAVAQSAVETQPATMRALAALIDRLPVNEQADIREGKHNG